MARDKRGKHLALPKLASLLAKPSGVRRHKKQTPEQMLAIVKMLNAAFGGSTVNTTEH